MDESLDDEVVLEEKGDEILDNEVLLGEIGNGMDEISDNEPQSEDNLQSNLVKD